MILKNKWYSNFMFSKQVDSSHYEFGRYMSKARWNSLWHQIDEVTRLKPKSILEIGPGAGAFKAITNIVGLHTETLDIDPELKPDHISSVFNIPFQDNTYDVVCAFQMLEHLPYEKSLKAFGEMVRVAKRNIIVSLPDSKPLWSYSVYLPRLGLVKWLLPRPFFRRKKHIFDGEHYWEINKRDFPIEKICTDLGVHALLVKTYRVHENSYHRFFVFEK